MAGFFKDKEEVQRVVDAVRYVERIRMTEDPQFPSPLPAFKIPVNVLITADRIVDTTPPFSVDEGGQSNAGFYPATIVFRNSGSNSPSDDWQQLDNNSGYCLAKGTNDSDLVVGQYYKGTIEGVRNTVPVVDVVESASASTPGGDVWGPEHSFTGAFACFSGPDGRFIKVVKGFRFVENTFFGSFPGQYRGNGLNITVPGQELNYNSSVTSNIPAYQLGTLIGPPATFSLNVGDSFTYDISFSYGTSSSPFDGHFCTDYWNEGALQAIQENIRFLGNACNGFIYTEVKTIGGVQTVVRSHSSTSVKGLQYWMVHYSSDGTQGVSGGTGFKDGIFVAQQAAVSPLSGSATQTDIITKVNELITKITNLGLV